MLLLARVECTGARVLSDSKVEPESPPGAVDSPDSAGTATILAAATDTTSRQLSSVSCVCAATLLTLLLALQLRQGVVGLQGRVRVSRLDLPGAGPNATLLPGGAHDTDHQLERGNPSHCCRCSLCRCSCTFDTSSCFHRSSLRHCVTAAT